MNWKCSGFLSEMALENKRLPTKVNEWFFLLTIKVANTNHYSTRMNVTVYWMLQNLVIRRWYLPWFTMALIWMLLCIKYVLISYTIAIQRLFDVSAILLAYTSIAIKIQPLHLIASLYSCELAWSLTLF